MKFRERIILKVYGQFFKYFNLYKCLQIRNNKKISVGKNVLINPNAEVIIKGGGSISINDNTEINYGVLIITYKGCIKIGSNCSINPYTIIYGHHNTTIGNNVLIAGHCMIIPNTHTYSNINQTIYDQGCTGKGIIIQDDVWIGHGCSILDNVIIGRGSVIAAGSVVNRNVPPYSIYGGVPAKFIRKRGESTDVNC